MQVANATDTARYRHRTAASEHVRSGRQDEEHRNQQGCAHGDTLGSHPATPRAASCGPGDDGRLILPPDAADYFSPSPDNTLRDWASAAYCLRSASGIGIMPFSAR